MLCIEQNDEWLVGRGYLSAESISLVLAGPDDHTDKEIKEEVARAPSGLSRQRPHRRASAALLHHVPGLDSHEQAKGCCSAQAEGPFRLLSGGVRRALC